MKKLIKLSLILPLIFCVCSSYADKIRVACIGDSITYGAYLKNRTDEAYPSQLAKILGEKYDVQNFGLNGATALSKGNIPYVKTKNYDDALKFNPNIVVIKLGTNDSKERNARYIKKDFENDLTNIIDSFKKLPTNPRIYVCIPVPAFMSGKEIDADRVKYAVIPRVKNVANKQKLELINLYEIFDDKGEFFPDKIHPNAEGAKLIAEKVAKHILAIRVACVGDSITYGSRLTKRMANCYPTQLGNILGDKYNVQNFGVSGRTALSKGDRPYIQTEKYQDALNFEPNIVIIKLGTNDTKSQNMAHIDEFEKDVSSLVESFQTLRTKPTIYLCLPVPAFMKGKHIDADRVKNVIIPKVQNVAKKYNLETINLHNVFDGKGEFFPDKIHPNAEGAKMMAETISKRIAK